MLSLHIVHTEGKRSQLSTTVGRIRPLPQIPQMPDVLCDQHVLMRVVWILSSESIQDH